MIRTRRYVRFVLFSFIALVSAFLLWLGQRRTFLCVGDGRCVTVWKTYGNKCYLVPGKYYGVTEPECSHATTSNTAMVDFIWPSNSNTFILSSGSEAQISNRVGDIQLQLYSENQQLNDSLYTRLDGRNRVYRDGVTYLTVDIKDGYSTQSPAKARK